MTTHMPSMIVTLFAIILFSTAADAQWVFLGRKAMGAVSRLTTKTPDSPGYDVASVLIEARPEKVFEAALKILKEKHHLKITYIDDKTRSVEFTDDKRVVGIKAIPMGETVTHLLISSSGYSGGSGTAPTVVDSVFRVCKEMGVACVLSEE